MSAPLFDEDALAAAWERGKAAERAGDIGAAADAYAACLAIDPNDHCGAALKLAACGRSRPTVAPPAYVATLFDQEAETFDDTLVRRLGYDVPNLMRKMAAPHAPFRRVLDLGCGTGLVGAAFADVSETIIGVDLSEGMLAVADDRGAYEDLYVGDAVAFAAGWDEDPFDVVTAADVLPYLGDLKPFAAAIANALCAGGGLLIVSTESADAGWRVTNTQRFAHSLSYLAETLEAAGLTVRQTLPITVRYEEGAPVKGDLLLAARA